MPLSQLLSPRGIFFALALSAPLPALVAAEPALTLKDGEVWVMTGDSITAQRMHTNYIEAYYRTRFPKLHLHFRNSGISGNRTGNVLARFNYDVAAWKPTIVSVELGMNDVNGPEEAYVKGLHELVAKIRGLSAQPVLISSSPVDDGSMAGDWRSKRCEGLDGLTKDLAKIAAEERLPMADQYHPLLDLWGQNRRKGAEAAAKSPAPASTPAPAPLAAGATPKPAPMPPSLIPLKGDSVHPGDVGQYMMAATILLQLGAPHEVSSAALTKEGKVAEAKRCQISEVGVKDGVLSFTRLDEASPWPILPSAKAAVQLLPDILKLSEYQLKVSGLEAGAQYQVSIEGKPAATVTGQELGAGWNITSAFDSVLGQRAVSLLKLIGTLQGPLNVQWRDASKANNAEKLEAAQKAIDEAEAKVQEACQPVPLHFEIAPAK